MSQASSKDLFSVPTNKVFKQIMDFESYPDFIPEVKACKVLKETKSYKEVEMTVNFVKEATYIIRAEWEQDKKMWWSLVSGDFFKKNDGLWELEAIGSQTQVTYSLDVEFKIFVPSFVLKKAVKVSLPQMIQNFKKRLS